MAKKKNKKKDLWHIPEDALDYFDPHYDDEFRAKHPILFWLTVAAIIVLVLVGPIAYAYCITLVTGSATLNGSWLQMAVFFIGFVSSFGISIAVCNLFMLLYKQYLGHIVTLVSLAAGIVIPGLCLLAHHYL